MGRISLRNPSVLGGGDRGLLPVLGVIVLLLVVVLGIAVIGVLGGESLTTSRQSIEIAQAEQAVSHLDREASAVALGLEPSTDESTVALHQSARRAGISQSAWLDVTIVNATTGVASLTVVNASPLGTIEYEYDETAIAFEGGGVWRSDDGASVMVAPPEFHYRNGTLTLPIITIAGDRALTDPIRIRNDGPTDRRYPNASAGLVNRLPDGKVRITVGSAYYEAWGRYFERTTNGIVRYNRVERTASVTFLALPRTISLDEGIIATAGTGELALAGNGAYTDSYDSSQGTYSETQAQNGHVWAAGDVTMVGSSAVNGDIRSGRDVSLSGTADVLGDVYWTTSYDPAGASVAGTASQIDGIGTIEPIDGFVDQTVVAAASANDNGNTSLIQDDRLVFDGVSSGTLTAGTYYLTDLSLFGTTSGLIEAGRETKAVTSRSSATMTCSCSSRRTERSPLPPR